jgi:formylglycine-generating enzyme required for sulfatase activity
MNTEPWLKHGVPTGDDYPAVCISWDDAQKFCSRLSERLKEKWRLPTETEWEYACRAGTITKYSCDDADLPQYAWYLKTTIDAKLRPVATKLPNPFGLFDMHGGVWEWCQDEYRQNYDSGTTAAENSKVCRGGSTRIAEENIRSAARMGANAAKIHEIHGFRVVRELKQRQQFIT